MEMFNIYIAHFLYEYNQMRFTTLCGDFARLLHAVHNFMRNYSVQLLLINMGQSTT